MTHLTPEQVQAVAQGTPDALAQSHAETCPACRAALVDARGRVRLLAGLRAQTLSDVAFRRVEARLMEQVDEGLAPRWNPWRFALLGLSAAAVGALALVAFSPRPVAPPAPTVAVAPPQAPVPVAYLPLTVLRVPGETRVAAGASWRALAAGDVLAEGARLSGGPVVLAAGSRQAWSVQGEFSLGRGASVALEVGSLVAAVQGAPAQVLAASSGLSATDAVFSVSRTAAEMVVEVAQGEVDAFEASDARAPHRRLVAPTRVRFALGQPLLAGAVEAPQGVEAPRVPRQPWARVDTAALPRGSRLSLDGLALGQAPAGFLWEAGRARLSVTPPGQPTQVRFLDLVGGKELALAASPAAPERTVEVEPDAEALSRVMADLRRQTPKLQACYEKWLKAHPQAEGEVVLTLTVSARGHVTRAAVQGEGLSPESAGCLSRTARTLVLPALGSEQDLELPLLLRQAGR